MVATAALCDLHASYHTQHAPSNTGKRLAAGNWNLTHLPNAPQPNTYDVVFLDRSSECSGNGSYLSTQPCNGTRVFVNYEVSA